MRSDAQMLAIDRYRQRQLKRFEFDADATPIEFRELFARARIECQSAIDRGFEHSAETRQQRIGFAIYVGVHRAILHGIVLSTASRQPRRDMRSRARNCDRRAMPSAMVTVGA